jgi:hypothetical protein
MTIPSLDGITLVELRAQEWNYVPARRRHTIIIVVTAVMATVLGELRLTRFREAHGCLCTATIQDTATPGATPLLITLNCSDGIYFPSRSFTPGR